MKSNNEINTHFLFEKVNYKILLTGIGVIALGFILMSGGGSDDPNVFSEDIFNFRRIRLAPTLVLAGFGITIYAILKDPAGKKDIVMQESIAEKEPAKGEKFPVDAPIKNFKKKKK